jgi:replicative DNA helicase
MNDRFDRDKYKPRVQAIDVAGRVPPHNDDAEAAVLASVLTEVRAFDEVVEILPSGEAFYADANRRIYDTCVALHTEGQSVDIMTVSEVLKRQNMLQAIGGLSYLAHLVDKTPAVAHVAAHAAIVREKHRIRELITRCQMIAAEGYGDYGNAQEFIDKAEQSIYEIARTTSVKQAELLYDALQTAFKKLEIAIERGGGVTGLATGFTDLDKMTGGFHDGELILIAGRPGSGKTSMALNLAINAAAPKKQQAPGEELRDLGAIEGVFIFSMEMPGDQLANRIMCSEARVDVAALRQGHVQGEAWDRLVTSINEIGQYPLWIDDSPALTVLELRARVRRKQAEFNKRDADGKLTQRVGLVLVDYLQLMKSTVHPNASREQQVSQISGDLKAMAKDLHLPVVGLAQLNRGTETRGTKDKRPQLADLRDSGSLEQDADVVLMIYRPAYYEEVGTEAHRKVKDIAEVLVRKQRNGPTGRVILTFLDYCTRFENRDPASKYDPDGD